jgi:hypothetical protein
VILVSTVIQILASVLTQAKGWGLQPVSWGWIIGCGFFVSLFAKVLLAMDATDRCLCPNCTSYVNADGTPYSDEDDE